MQYFFYFVFSLILLTPNSRAGVVEPTAKNTTQYPAEFVQQYQQECVQTSIAEGLEEVEAQRLCNCTIKEFQQQYALEEFQQLTVASATDKESETALVEVGQFCFEQLLYEE
ncbi:MAG: hypothetical protein AAFQ14_10560 [Cyanobacteria bacterium J06621_12]